MDLASQGSRRDRPSGSGSGMRKAFSASGLVGSGSGSRMQRTPSGQFLADKFHSGNKWEEQGGWQSTEPAVKKLHRNERDASMVNLLNLIDPQSLIDKKPEPGQEETDQHSALSSRGVLYVGGLSACAWWALRLALRDVFGIRREVIELHTLNTIHAAGWAGFLATKVGATESDLPKYCSRALVISLGYYVQACWALRGTVMSNPLSLIHQASMTVTVTSILRSKGVAWLALPIMSQAVPNLLQELLRFCGSIGLQAVRPEVRSLRLLWFLSFVASKLAVVPTWFKYNEVADMHQPNLFRGKLSYVVCFLLDLIFIRSALGNLSQFLKPAGVVLPLALAYKQPLQGAQAAGTSLVAACVLGTIFGSYLMGPVAFVLALLGLRRGSSRTMQLGASFACSAVVLDQLLPQPKRFPESTRILRPLFTTCLKVFNFKIFSEKTKPSESDPHGLQFLKDLPRDRHHLIATTPHGLFPWGAGTVIVSCIEAGYMPNFVGASVLGALPVAGRLLRHCGFRAATKSEILRTLKEEYPRNVTIILPGGIREMFQIREDIEISAANLHSGFCDIAKEGGCMLVPSYAFGVSQLYKVARGPLADFFSDLSRRLKASIALFTGRWGTLLPYPYEMAAGMGEPIDTLAFRDGKEVHRLYLERLRDAFEAHKEAFGWDGRELYFEGEEMPALPTDDLDVYTALPSSTVSKL